MSTTLRQRKTLAILAICAMTVGVSGCASAPAEPVVKTVTVSVAVPVSCITADYPPSPAYTDTLAALHQADDFAARYQLLAANKALHVAREALDEATINACRKAAPAK